MKIKLLFLALVSSAASSFGQVVHIKIGEKSVYYKGAIKNTSLFLWFITPLAPTFAAPILKGYSKLLG
jgi:hypothetical protein